MSGYKLVTLTSATNPVAHDLEIDDVGQLVWIGGDVKDKTSYATMVVQRLKCRWLEWQGEWYLDQRRGTPWEQAIFRKGITAARLRKVFREVALGTPGVRSVVRVAVTMDRRARQAAIDFDLTMENRAQVSSDQLDAPFIVPIPEAA